MSKILPLNKMELTLNEMELMRVEDDIEETEDSIDDWEDVEYWEARLVKLIRRSSLKATIKRLKNL